MSDKLEDTLKEVDEDWCKDEPTFVAGLCHDAGKKITKLKKKIKLLKNDEKSDIVRKPRPLRHCINCGKPTKPDGFCDICNEFGKEQY